MPEPIQIVEIKQPFCENVFGVSPCTATGTGDQKCYNTRRTCKDTVNFALGTPLSLFFSTGDVAARGVSGASYIMPFLVSVSTTPTRINLSGSSPDATGLGTRANCSITFQDAPHTDRIVDPYLSGRSWDPLTPERGSFWTRWLPRNKYYQNVEVVVYEGYAGQALGDMVSRTYFVEKITGPDASGRVTMTGKDILARVEERKAQAPIASPGVLYVGIAAGATSFEVAGAVVADYAASGVLRINSEIMQYTGRASSTNGVTFTGVTRGRFNTTAQEHEVDSTVQQCLYYENTRADDVVEDLLTTYGGIDPAWLDTSNWANEFDDYSAFYILDVLITDPESVAQIVADIAIQVGFYIWWDERDRLVKWKAIRGVDDEPPTLTDTNHILEGSFSITEMPRQRVSQAWIYHGRKDWIKSKDDPTAYNLHITANLESETDELYGSAAIRRIYARFLPSSALAQNTASKIITRYVDTPRECTFTLDAKDRAYWVGDTVKISHHLDRDEFGARYVANWTITSAEEVRAGEVVRYVAEDTTLYGRIHYVMASGAADYNPAGGNPFKNCFIGDANGLLSDGTPCGRIS